MLSFVEDSTSGHTLFMSLRPTSPQGQGRATRQKEAGFAALFLQSLRISKDVKVANYPYWHIDLNCGSGFNEQAGCEGSPLVFLRQAIFAERLVHAWFCDRDQDALSQLQHRLQGLALPVGSSIRYLDRDNAIHLYHLAQHIQQVERSPQYAMGTCLCDPNGFRQGFPIGAIAHFLDTFPRMDFILNINARLFRNALAVKKKWAEDPDNSRACFKGFQDWPTLPELIARFPRPNWFVSNPPRVQGDHFVILLGRTKTLRDRPFAGFYPLHSEVGQTIVHKLSHVAVGQRLLPFGD